MMLTTDPGIIRRIFIYNIVTFRLSILITAFEQIICTLFCLRRKLFIKQRNLLSAQLAKQLD